jgi:hypothetical protein
MDVLRYSAANAAAKFAAELPQKISCVNTKTPQVADLLGKSTLFTAQYACWVNCIEPQLLIDPSLTDLWSNIATGSNWTGGLKVCGADGQSGQYMSQGRDCTWTVPAGVTCARFQIWGAGSGAGGGGACCSLSPFGSTAAFTSVIIPVTAGNTYTIHSGCAPLVCAYCTYQSQRPHGDKSFVQGPALCNVCADGGIGELGAWMACNGRTAGSNCYWGSKCNIGSSTGVCCGFALCAQGSFACWSATGVGVCCLLPFTPGAAYFGSSPVGAVYGIKGMFPGASSMAGTGNVFTYACHPPVYGFESTSFCCQSQCLYSTCGATYQACCGYNRTPGAGASPSFTCGGSTESYGDCSGRFGMVCVCYK